MSSVYEISAPAKINVYLKITGKLPNGYHRLNMLMQTISISDNITITIDDKKAYDIVTSCDEMPDIPNNKNLCYKAATRYLAAYRNKTGNDNFPYIEIKLEKVIPSEAGLGGGSSDAAAVILALDDFLGNPLTPEELNTVAANTGADTPFFLYGEAAICEGFGEIITPMNSLSDIPMILVKPTEGVSTPACFAAFDEMASEQGIVFDEDKYLALRDELSKAEDPRVVLRKYRDLLVNDLEAPANQFVPVIADVKALLNNNGAMFAMMSGSGSSVYALFDSIESRDAAYDAIIKDELIAGNSMKVYKCETL